MSDGKERRYSAVIRMTIEVEHNGPWDGDCTVAQIEDQASREAEQGFLNTLQNVKPPYKCRVTGTRVEHVTILREKKQ